MDIESNKKRVVNYWTCDCITYRNLHGICIINPAIHVMAYIIEREVEGHKKSLAELIAPRNDYKARLNA